MPCALEDIAGNCGIDTVTAQQVREIAMQFGVGQSPPEPKDVDASLRIARLQLLNARHKQRTTGCAFACAGLKQPHERLVDGPLCSWQA